MNFPEHVRDFAVKNIALWRIDGSDLTLETDASVPMGKIRQNFLQDVAAEKRFELDLPFVHWSTSFEGVTGTYVYGRGWRLHKPSGKSGMDLWESVSYGSQADWTAVMPDDFDDLYETRQQHSKKGEKMSIQSTDLIETQGVRALNRLYEIACGNSGQCRYVAHFLLGLYNGPRFPFDLTDLRAVDAAIFNDCMLLLRLDAQLTRKEVHKYFENGGEKFEQLARDWNVANASPAPLVQEPGQFTFRDGDLCDAKLVTYSEAPGYRSVGLTLSFGPKKIKADIRFSPDDAVEVMRHIKRVNEFCWSDGGRPLDAKEGETRPKWL